MRISEYVCCDATKYSKMCLLCDRGHVIVADWYVLSILLLVGLVDHGKTEQVVKQRSNIENLHCNLTCDIRDTAKDCTQLSITGINLSASTSCIYYTDETWPTNNITTNANIVTSSQITCNIPHDVGRNGTHFRKYYIRLSNNGNMKDEMNGTLCFLVFDSHCVQCNHSGPGISWECMQRDDVCVIEDTCRNDGYVDPQDECKVCKPSKSKNKLVYKQDAELTCKEHAVQLTCSETEMSATVNKDMFITDNVNISYTNCDDYTTVGDSINVKFANCAVNIGEIGDWIVQENYLAVTVAYILPPIRRKMTYLYRLECKFNRNLNVSLSKPVLVRDREKTPDVVIVANGKFNVSMTLYTSNLFILVRRPPFEFTAFEPIYIRIETINKNDLFNFVTQQCFATPSNDVNSLVRYVFFDEKCKLDATFQEYGTGNRYQYDFSVGAFKFITLKGSVYFHCKLLICKALSNSDECRQKCHITRHRRSASEGTVQTAYVQSGPISFKKKPTCLDVTCPKGAYCIDLHPAQCRCVEGHVLDHVTKKCTSERLLIVTDLHLDINFLPAYANHSSDEFLRLAINVEHQLATLFPLDYDFVRGVKVIDVKKGSVILELLMIYSPTKTPKDAFDSFVKTVMKENEGAVKRVTVIRGILPRMKKPVAADDSLLLLIILVPVVLFLFFLAVITWFVVRRNWYRNSNVISSSNVITSNDVIFQNRNARLVQSNSLRLDQSMRMYTY